MPKSYTNVEAMNEQSFLEYTKREKLNGTPGVATSRDFLSLGAAQSGDSSAEGATRESYIQREAIDSSAEGTIREKSETEKALANMLPMQNGEVDIASLGDMVKYGRASEYQKSQYQLLMNKINAIKTQE